MFGSGLLWFTRDMALVVVALASVESDRRRKSPQSAAAASRRRAIGCERRCPEERVRLRRAIALVDSWMPKGPNCLRRSLLEVSLDAGAAEERLLAGFKSGGLAGTGHAWLESQPVAERYDAVIAI